MNTRKVPQSLQAVLPSKLVSELSLSGDRSYIVHQVLSHGSLADMRWLFDTYGEEMVKKTFVSEPMKVYSASSQTLVKLLLQLKEQEAPQERYDQTFPRHS